ncbi:hypothetical protein V6N11_020398 [Hibiscus sabdariffa]|uniref:Uncharacterized protein n=1 Tax=Hibiscus sabdariffa TaxID=183260 RepID=A0ABR2Q8M8_9ROSI
MTNVPKLEKLHLGGNKLSGNIPSSISNASMLKILELEDNFLSGIIPNVLGDLRHLEWFQISNNSLTTEAATHEWDFLSSLVNCRNLTHRCFTKSIERRSSYLHWEPFDISPILLCLRL